MMTKNQFNEREQLEMLAIDQLVPQDHLVHKLTRGNQHDSHLLQLLIEKIIVKGKTLAVAVDEAYKKTPALP